MDATTSDPSLTDEFTPELHDVETALAILRSSRGAPGSFRRLRRLYRFGNELVRYRIVSGVIASNLKSARRLLQDALLHEHSSLIRHEAAFGLGSLGCVEAIPLLIEKGLNDSSYLVRHEAAMALSAIGDESALPQLERGLSDRNHEVALSCRLAVGAIKYRMRSRHGR